MTQYIKHFCLVVLVLVSILSFNGCIMMPFMLKNMLAQQDNGSSSEAIQTVDVLVKEAAFEAAKTASPIKRLEIGRTLIYKDLMSENQFRKLLSDALEENPKIIFSRYGSFTHSKNRIKQAKTEKGIVEYYVLSTQLFREYDNLTLIMQLIDPISYQPVVTRILSKPIIKQS